MDNFIRSPRNQIVLILSLLTFSSTYLWWTLRYVPRQAEIESLTSRNLKLAALNEETRRAIGTIGMDKVSKALEAFSAQQEAVSYLLPPDSAKKSLLPLISDKARENQVTLTNVSPKGAELEGDYSFDKYDITAQGKYHDIGAFITSLGSLNQIAHVTALKATVVSPADALGSMDATRLINASFVLKAYMRPTLSATDTAVAERVAPLEDTQPQITYEKDANGQLWQLVKVAGKENPVRLPVPPEAREEAEAALLRGSN